MPFFTETVVKLFEPPRLIVCVAEAFSASNVRCISVVFVKPPSFILAYLTSPVKVWSALFVRVMSALNAELYFALPLQLAPSINTIPVPFNPPHFCVELYSGLLRAARTTVKVESELTRFTTPPIFTVSAHIDTFVRCAYTPVPLPIRVKSPPIEISESIGLVLAALPICTSTPALS